MVGAAASSSVSGRVRQAGPPSAFQSKAAPCGSSPPCGGAAPRFRPALRVVLPAYRVRVFLLRRFVRRGCFALRFLRRRFVRRRFFGFRFLCGRFLPRRLFGFLRGRFGLGFLGRRLLRRRFFAFRGGRFLPRRRFGLRGGCGRFGGRLGCLALVSGLLLPHRRGAFRRLGGLFAASPPLFGGRRRRALPGCFRGCRFDFFSSISSICVTFCPPAGGPPSIAIRTADSQRFSWYCRPLEPRIAADGSTDLLPMRSS